ncbi:MAG: hypothetical protein HY057_08420 [Rhodospirillales bacterium]|nr:hypothetical protein [Rhodospirillales bacterium]
MSRLTDAMRQLEAAVGQLDDAMRAQGAVAVDRGHEQDAIKTELADAATAHACETAALRAEIEALRRDNAALDTAADTVAGRLDAAITRLRGALAG